MNNYGLGKDFSFNFQGFTGDPSKRKDPFIELDKLVKSLIDRIFRHYIIDESVLDEDSLKLFNFVKHLQTKPELFLYNGADLIVLKCFESRIKDKWLKKMQKK